MKSLLILVVFTVVLAITMNITIPMLKEARANYLAESKCMMNNITVYARNEMYGKDGQCFVKSTNKQL